jgi:hypothetical protein
VSNWSAHRPSNEVHRRAGGRRGYNRLRQIRATERRVHVAQRIVAAGGIHHGLQAQIARDFGVDRSTINRDVTAIVNGGSVGVGLYWYGDDY